MSVPQFRWHVSFKWYWAVRAAAQFDSARSPHSLVFIYRPIPRRLSPPLSTPAISAIPVLYTNWETGNFMSVVYIWRQKYLRYVQLTAQQCVIAQEGTIIILRKRSVLALHHCSETAGVDRRRRKYVTVMHSVCRVYCTAASYRLGWLPLKRQMQRQYPSDNASSVLQSISCSVAATTPVSASCYNDAAAAAAAAECWWRCSSFDVVLTPSAHSTTPRIKQLLRCKNSSTTPSCFR